MPATHKSRTPFGDALQKYVADRVLSFHTPGHKAGRGFPAKLKGLLASDFLAYDLTYVPELGDLYESEGPVYQAQTYLAQLYGADRSFFLVNGTTGGIHAMLAACLSPGDKVILPRNVHRSVIGALVISGAMPVFIEPEYDAARQIALQVTAKTVETAIHNHPEAKAVLLINPTYHGVAANVESIAPLVHAAGMLLLVDEAHGAHLHFSGQLPVSAFDAGADVVVQSAHKTLGVLSQGSWLHCRQGRIDVPRLAKWLELLQTSSPNYILLASMEAATEQLRTSGRNLAAQTVALACETRQRLTAIPGLCILGQVDLPDEFSLDFTKIFVSVRGLGLTGRAAEQWLRENSRIQPELSDDNSLLFLMTPADTRHEADKLVEALRRLAETQDDSIHAVSIAQSPSVPITLRRAQIMPPRRAVYGRQERIGLEQAAGRVSAETVYLYPPGIPFLVPGENISPEIAGWLLQAREAGTAIMGLEDTDLRQIKVMAE